MAMKLDMDLAFDFVDDALEKFEDGTYDRDKARSLILSALDFAADDDNSGLDELLRKVG